MTTELGGGQKRSGGPAGGSWRRGESTGGFLDDDAEALVHELGEALARLAYASAGGEMVDGPNVDAVAGAIGGAEILIRSELIARRGHNLEKLLPGFVYMVTLPHLEQETALALSRRTEELLAQEPPGVD